MGTLMGLVITLVLSVVTMRSCQSSDPSSPSNPENVARHATTGVCADQQAVVAAGSVDDTVPAVTLPPDLAARLSKADPTAAAILGQASDCPSPTTQP